MDKELLLLLVCLTMRQLPCMYLLSTPVDTFEGNDKVDASPLQHSTYSIVLTVMES